MSEPAALRPMGVADLDAVLAIELRAYPFPWSRGNFIDSIAAGHVCWVQTLGGQIVAYLVAMHGVEEMHLLNITVAPEQQGRGWALGLLRHLAQACQQAAAASLWLEVRASNTRARQVYERWGFEAVGLRRGYYPAAASQREDAVVMRYSPSQPASAPLAASPAQEG